MTETMTSRDYIKTINGSAVKDMNASHDNELNKSRGKRNVDVSTQAWNENIRYERERQPNYRPSSAPHNEHNYYIRSGRANSSQSFQDSTLLNNPTMYQRFNKLSRQQRSRVVPEYYETYDNRILSHEENDSILLSDIPEQNSNISNLRHPYYASRSRNDQMRRLRGIDNMGYVRTSNEPFLIDDLNEPNSLQRSRPLAHHLSYNDKYLTVPKRTEILYIQSPMTVDERPEDLMRSISQNDMHSNEERALGNSPKIPLHSKENLKQVEPTNVYSSQRQRQVSFTDQNVSNLSIPEEVTVPGMVRIDSKQKSKPVASKSSSGKKQSINEINVENDLEDNQNSDDSLENPIYSSVNIDEKKPHSSHTRIITDPNIGNRVAVDSLENSVHSNDEIETYKTYKTPNLDEKIQITSISGVPVSIELTNGHNKQLNQSINSIGVNSRKNALRKGNSTDNSEKSYDSDSGLGRPGVNTKVDFDIKNSGLMEKKSVFTIAYNDVKTRQLQSAESIGD
jgi:hypothetical protein